MTCAPNRLIRRTLFGLGIICAASLLGPIDTASAEAPKKLTLYTASFPGFAGAEEPNPGILVELARIAGEKTGYSIEQKVVPWARAIKLARTEKNALISGFTRLESREHNFAWIVRQLTLKNAFISLDRAVNSYEDARKLSAIGVHRATSYEVELEERGFENIRSFSNPDRIIKFFDGGRIDAWFGSIHEFTKRLEGISPAQRKRIVIGKPVLTEEQWLAGPKHLSPKVIEDLNYGTRWVIEQGHRERLIKKHFGDLH